MLISDIIQLFRKGKIVVNPVAWKSSALIINAVSAFLVAAFELAKGLGYDLQMSQPDIDGLAGGVASFVVLYNSIVHVVSTNKIGFDGVDVQADGDGNTQSRDGGNAG